MERNCDLWQYMDFKVDSLRLQSSICTSENCCKIRFIPVTVRDETGDRLNLDEMPLKELVSRYRNLQRKYNTLVGELSKLVRV